MNRLQGIRLDQDAAAGFHTATQALPYIPDNLTLAQFMLDYHHDIQPIRSQETPCLIEEANGRGIGLDELRERTYGLANALSFKYAISESDIALIISPNHVDYPVAIWAIHRLGGIVTCSNPQFTAEELAYQLRVSKATILISHSEVLPTALAAAHVVGLPFERIITLDQSKSSRCIRRAPAASRRGFTKVAFLCWSSGTTGNPKAVAIPHRALIANIIQMAAHNQVDKVYPSWESRAYRPGDVAIGVLPFYHVAGLVINLHFVLFCAMSVVVVEKYRLLDMLKSIERHRISHLFLVPPQAVGIAKYPSVGEFDLSSVKYTMIGAAPVAQEVQEKLFELLPRAQIGQAYGLTEMTTTLVMIPPMQKRSPPGSSGRLLPGIQARVIKADGTLAGYGEPGELVVKGPSAALGYFENDEATAETFVDGWIHTGDEVIITRNQEVFVFDRLKEILKVNGYQVAPAELEGCLLGHPDVVDCCVVSIPDVYSGELPLAYVVLSTSAVRRISGDSRETNLILDSITKHVADRKANYKHLKGGVRLLTQYL
ncbi:hypothetical protein BD779DRAFT_1668497 [Infundibulicybe gibba]|nr:hypothetical protein BD779DRAFT_1668497 [Infundibulicybe gibba]